MFVSGWIFSDFLLDYDVMKHFSFVSSAYWASSRYLIHILHANKNFCCSANIFRFPFCGLPTFRPYLTGRLCLARYLRNFISTDTFQMPFIFYESHCLDLFFTRHMCVTHWKEMCSIVGENKTIHAASLEVHAFIGKHNVSCH